MLIQLVFFDHFLQIKSKSADDLELLYSICKEGVQKNSLEKIYLQKQATNKFMIGNLLLTDSVLSSIRKELKTVYPDLKVTNEEIYKVILNGVVKREIIEGEESEEAKGKIAKALKTKEKVKSEKIVESRPSAESPISDELPGIPLS